MFRKIFYLFVVGALLASCQSASNDVRDAARQNVTSNNAVQPANPNAAATPAPPQAAATPTGPTTNMTFAETEFNFGTVLEGEKVSHTYTFTNSGNEPLILSNAQGSCGCTVPKWPREPIAAGESADIIVEFNSKGKRGTRNQKVTITANTNPPQTFIYLKGEVTPADAQPNIQVTQ